MTSTSAWFLPLLVCVGFVAFEFAMAGEEGWAPPYGMEDPYESGKDKKSCSVGRYGTLTLFNGETADVKLPCKYRLADFTCGDYRVTVTPGSAQDQEYSHRFSPNTVWVKVVNTKTDDFLKMRTSVKRLDEYANGTVDMAWQVRGGNAIVVDSALYDPSKAAAVLSKNGVFSVELSSAERSVVVSCSDEEFVSKGLPETLCGDGTTTDAMVNSSRTVFPENYLTDDEFLNYVVLNHDNVVQSQTCMDLASKFSSCKDKLKAAMVCRDIFGYQAECLAGSDTSLRDYYANCLTSVCDDDPSAVIPMNDFIRDYCV